MDAAGPRRLRIAVVAKVIEHLADDHRHLPDIGEAGGRRRVEVDPELVRAVDILGADGPGIEIDAAQVHHPGKVVEAVADDKVGTTAAGKLDQSVVTPVGRLWGRASDQVSQRP